MKRAHPSAAAKAKEAQDAALPPADDLAGQAKAAKLDTMDAQHRPRVQRTRRSGLAAVSLAPNVGMSPKRNLQW